MLINIYGNITTDSDLFKSIDPEIYIPLTRFIAKDIDRKTHISDVEQVVIIPSKDSISKCYWLRSPKGGNGRYHVIEINIDHPDSTIRTLQWIQVFAHEYMHHAIDRKEGRTANHPLVWFDEMLCHTSSTCCAADLYRDLRHNSVPELQWMKDKRDSFMQVIGFATQVARNHLVAQSIRDGKGIRQFFPFPQDGLDLALCTAAIASCVETLFFLNPNLWKIVPHVNEIPMDADIDTLFSHLKKTADPSYKDSLQELINLLLP